MNGMVRTKIEMTATTTRDSITTTATETIITARGMAEGKIAVITRISDLMTRVGFTMENMIG